MDKVAKLLRIIPAAEVAKRWGVGAANLQEMLGCDPDNYNDDGDDYELAVYTAPQKRIRPHDGQVVYFCTGPFFGFLKKYGKYDLEGYYFNTDDVEAYEAAHPEAAWPVVEEDSSLRPAFSNSALDDDPFANFIPPPVPEDIPIEEIRKELGMSRLQFVAFLNYGGDDSLPTSCEEEFSKYRHSYDHRDGKAPYYTIAMLESLTVERIDWENWKARQEARQSDAQGKEPAAEYSHDGSELLGRVAELESQLAEVQAERGRLSEALKAATARIAELEAADPAYDVALQERDAQIATLQSEVDTVRGIINQCGALSVVVKMLEGGSAKEDIAIFLKGEGLSYSQIGALLHADPLGVSGDAIQQCAKRLLGVATK